MSFAAVLQRSYNTRVSDDLVTYKVLILLDCPKLIEFVRGKKKKKKKKEKKNICKFTLQNVKHMEYQPVWLPVMWFKTL